MAATKRAAKKAAKKTAKRATAKKTTTRPARRTPKKDTPLLPVMKATGRPRGRPPKIDQPSLIDPSKTVGVAIVDLVADGLPPDVAAGLAGITSPTLDVWLSRGAAEITRVVLSEDENEPMLESELSFVAVCEELTMADAASRGTALLTLKRLGERNHPAMLAYMGARWPTIYGQKTRLEVTGANGGPVRTSVTIPSLDEAERRIGEIEAANRDRLTGAIDVQSREAS